MKIFCEYCGVQIDVNKDSKCPNCGASFEHNVSYKKIREHKKKHEELDLREREINIENKKMVQENVKNITGAVKNFSRVFWVIFAVIAIVVVTMFIFIFSKIINTSKNMQSENIKDNLDIMDDFFDDEELDKDVVVNMNEYAETTKYRVMVDSYEEVDLYPQKPKDGYKFISFHFILENISGSKMYLFEKVNCVVDGISQSEAVDFDRDSLPTSISKDLKVQGYETFEVPINTESYSIKFGDYVTININM